MILTISTRAALRRVTPPRFTAMASLALGACLAAMLASCQSNEANEVDAARDTSAAVFDTDPEAAQLLPQALDDYQANLYEQSETRLAECMAEAGFDYEPGDPLEDGYQQVAPEILELPTETFVDEYAWGYATLVYVPHFYDPEADTNLVTRENLSAADQATWDESLTRCTQVLEVTAASDTYEFVQLRSAQQIGLGIYTEDPRVAAEYARWSTCIADAGIDGLNVPLDVETQIRDAINQLVTNVGGPSAVSVEELQEMPEYEAIVEHEHKVASASLECNFPPPILQRNTTLNPILLESLRAGLDQLDEAELFVDE